MIFIQASGIQIISVGVMDNVNVDEVSVISSATHQENVNYFLSEDFDNLGQIRDAVTSSTCQGTEEENYFIIYVQRS